MKYSFKLESKTICGAAGGGSLIYAFQEECPGLYLFLWYIMKLRIS